MWSHGPLRVGTPVHDVTRSRLSTSGFFLWVGLLLLSLRPLPFLDRALDTLLVPARFVGELATPLAVIFQNRVAAAEAALKQSAPRELEENARVLAGLSRAAEPSGRAFLQSRRIVHAEVSGRVSGNRDSIELRLHQAGARKAAADPTWGILPGFPVASGDAYVGRVSEVYAGGRVEVDLVTGSDFHVGAAVITPEGNEVRMTVGGVRKLPRQRGGGALDIQLVIHQPSDRELEFGLARVDELFDDAEPFGWLSEGLRLGEVRRDQQSDTWSILPELDYLDGLYQVVILAPPDPAHGVTPPVEPVVYDGQWLAARPLGVGDPSPWRSSRKIAAGRSHGVRAGAAVSAIGARLVGRVQRAGLFTSDVSLLDDPGFSVVAVALVEGEEEPRVLGRLVSQGRDRDTGEVRFRWFVRVSLDLLPWDAVEPGAAQGDEEAQPLAPRRARLFTGSGDPGLPAGFFFGEAWLPVDSEPGQVRELAVVTGLGARDVRSLFVRTLPTGSTAGEEPLR